VTVTVTDSGGRANTTAFDWISAPTTQVTPVNEQSGLCLSTSSASGDLVQVACDVEPTRRWTLEASAYGGYQLLNARTGACMKVVSASGDPGAHVEQQSCSNHPAWTWRTVPVGTSFRLQNLRSGLCLAMESTTSGTVATQAACTAHASR